MTSFCKRRRPKGADALICIYTDWRTKEGPSSKEQWCCTRSRLQGPMWTGSHSKKKMHLSRDLWGSSNQIHQGPASPERIEEEAGQGVLTPQPEQASWGRGIDGGKVQSTPHITETFYCSFLMLWSWFQTNCLWILKLFLQAFIQQHQTLYSQTAAVCIRVSFGHVCQYKRHK